jgi:hypothetical protein
MTWFTRLTGVREKSAAYVREQLVVTSDGLLTSKANGKSWKHGRLEIPTLADLEGRVAALLPAAARIRVRFVTGDVAALHAAPANGDALFQVASQFNLLEMVSPSVTPEQGIGGYEHDRTQGPICAMSAGAGTIYRQYFVELPSPDEPSQVGQTAGCQINCLDQFATTLAQIAAKQQNTTGDATVVSNGTSFWKMENGYAMPSAEQLASINDILGTISTTDRQQLLASLRVGVQWGTQVTQPRGAAHCVSQIYCSALPVSYCHHPSEDFTKFACLILEGAYRATLAAAVLNAQGPTSGSQTVYLTLLGGGAFGNDLAWIMAAIHKALVHYQRWDLDVVIVSYRPTLSEKLALEKLVRDWSPEEETTEP